MTRWMAGIVIAFGLMPTFGLAQGPWSAPGVQQAGFHGQLPPPPGPPGNWHQPYNGDALTQYQLLPDDRGFAYDHDSRRDLNLGETISRSWIRFDYLLWDIKSPGNSYIGAPVVPEADLTAKDTATRLSAQDRILGVRPNTFVVVPTLGEFDFSGLNGARITMGIPTRVGTFEADAWALQQSSESFQIPPTVDRSSVFPISTIAAVPLLNNGVANNNTMILFSESYRVSTNTKLVGTEANWVFNPFDTAAPIQVSPSMGFRYIRMHERFSISGTDIPDPLNDPTTMLNHNISSRARNDVYGPQFGLKASTQLWLFTFDAETKFLFGLNQIEDQVGTQQIFTPAELPTLSSNVKTRFAPTFDLGLKLRCDVNDHVSLHVGYDLLVGDGYSRAFQNVYYDAPASVTEPPAIRLAEKRSVFFAQGLSIGGEILFW